MKYAIISAAGKQYQVIPGQELVIDRQAGKAGDKVKFDQVLMLVDGDAYQIGQPTVDKAMVEAEIIEQIRGPKIRVAKFKAKSRYRKVNGHRSEQSKIKIIKI